MADNNENNLMPSNEAIEKRRQDRRNRALRNTVILLAIIAVIGVVGYYTVIVPTMSEAGATSSLVNLPTVSSSLVSSKDGKAHKIDINLSVEYANDSPDVTEDALYKNTQAAIAKLDYEELKTPESMDYIEATVKNELKELLGNDGVVDIYIGNITIDFEGYVTNDPFPSKKKNSLDGLFKDMDK